jgi:hypothetical protein
MKAGLLINHGGPEVLRNGEAPDLTTGCHEATSRQSRRLHLA